MHKFLVLIGLIIFSCYNTVGQEKILVTKEYHEVQNYVKEKHISYREVTYNNNITILFEAMDSLNNEHIYAILFKTGKCISQTHIYNDPIPIDTVIHCIYNTEILEISHIHNEKYYNTFYELK